MTLIQEGPRDAKIVLVGEAPGATEASTGRPFVGGSGELLNRLLSRAGIERRHCFLTNLCHVRPPNNDFNHFLKPSIKREFITGLAQLRDDLRAIQPNVIIALGAQPLRWLTGLNSIEKWRGSIVPCRLVPGLKVVGTYHPAAVLRVYSYHALAIFDLKRAAAESTSKDIDLPRRTFYFTGAEQPLPQDDHSERLRIVWADRLLAEDLAQEFLSAEWLSVDIECTEYARGAWRISCVGFSDRPDRALVVDTEGGDSTWKRSLIHRICTSPVPKVMQNGSFDCTVLLDAGVRTENFAWDTMLAHHTLYLESASSGDELSRLSGRKRAVTAFAKGLSFQTSIYTREPYYKDDGKVWSATNNLPLFWRYNALDAAVTREIRDVQAVELQETQQTQVFERAMQLVWPLMNATRRGIKVNLDTLQRLKATYLAEIDRLQAFLDAIVGESVNVKSSPQVHALLYDRLGLTPQRNRKTGRRTANKDAIVALSEKHSHPVLGAIVQIRKRRDLVERYLNAAVDSDGRMRCSWDITGTSTGRLASRASIYGSGTNLQNQPLPIREMFVADEGRILISRDYSQAEARVVAYLADEDELIAFFNDPSRDVHRENASRIFGKPLTDITSAERYLAKRTIHACVDPSTEVLTPHGWEAICAITPEDMVAQWVPGSHEISFVKPLAIHQYPYFGPMLHFTGPSHDQLVTPNHRLPYMTNENDKVALASEIPLSGRLPISGLYAGTEHVDPNLIRLVCAIQADGSLPKVGNQVLFHLKRQRKVTRLRTLLDALVIDYRFSQYADGTVGIAFERDDQFLRWLTHDKRLSWRLLALDADGLDAVTEECLFWDGSISTHNHTRYEYLSADPDNIDVYQTICHLRHHGSKVTRQARCFAASVNNRHYARFESVVHTPYAGTVWCLTVPSSFFLVRRNGHISVTGNSNYGMQSDKFMQVVNGEGTMRITRKEASRLLDAYFLLYPKIRTVFWREVEDAIRTTSTLRTPLGRRRTFYGRLDDKLLNEAYAFIPQSTVGDLCCQALVRCHAAFPPEVDILLNVHDSLLVQCPIDMVDETAAIMQRCMEVPIPIRGRTLTIPTDCEVGYNWAKCSAENPMGMTPLEHYNVSGTRTR